MKKLVIAAVATIVVFVSGCASYGAGGTNSSLASGTQPAPGPFPSQVVGP